MSKHESMKTSELLVLVNNDVKLKHPKLTQKEIKAVYDSVLKQVMYAVADGYDVNLYGFGNFYYNEDQAREVRNIADGMITQVNAVRYPSFKSGLVFKSLVRSG